MQFFMAWDTALLSKTEQVLALFVSGFDLLKPTPVVAALTATLACAAGFAAAAAEAFPTPCKQGFLNAGGPGTRRARFASRRAGPMVGA